jgi:hypothetical protein
LKWAWTLPEPVAVVAAVKIDPRKTFFRPSIVMHSINLQSRLVLLDKELKAAEKDAKLHLRRHLRFKRASTVCKTIVHVANATAVSSVALSYSDAFGGLKLATTIATSVSFLVAGALSILDLDQRAARDNTAANQLTDLSREVRHQLLLNGMTPAAYARLHVQFTDKLSLINDSADAVERDSSDSHHERPRKTARSPRTPLRVVIPIVDALPPV